MDIFDYIYMEGNDGFLYPNELFKKKFNCRRKRIRVISPLNNFEDTTDSVYDNLVSISFKGSYLILDSYDTYWCDLTNNEDKLDIEFRKYFHKWQKIIRDDKINQILKS